MRALRPKTSPPVNSSKAEVRSVSSSFEIDATLAMNSKYSSGVRKSIRKPLSIYAPVNVFQSSLCCTSMLSRVTLPWSGLSRSSSSRKSVVFPAPLFPTSPIISPLPIDSCGMSQAHFSPNDFFRFCISITSFNISIFQFFNLQFSIFQFSIFNLPHTIPLPWQFLNFLPLPHGHGSLRPGSLSLTRGVRGCWARVSCAAAAA